MKKSKYCLDLLGVGDPNVRTFEIISCGSLRIAQRSNLTWNFEEDFCEETYFDDENDLFNKINLMNSDGALYQKCLDRQNYIVQKYMNVKCLKEYVNDIISKYYS
jgi:spore maturation protein CgeB